MNNIDLGFLVIAVAISAVLFGVGAIANRFWRDRIFSGLVPGMVPLAGAETQVSKVAGKSREYTGEVAVAFSPPKGLRPGLVGTIVDGQAEMRDLSATIVDLAVRGHLSIEAVDTDQRRVDDPTKKARDWSMTQVVPPPADELTPFEHHLMATLFSDQFDRPSAPSRGGVGSVDESDRSILMSEWVRTRRQQVADLRDSLYDQTVAYGWYERRPDQAKGGCLTSLVVVAAVGFSLLVVLAQPSVWTVLSALMITASAIWLKKRLHPRVPRTALGTAAQIQALGFKKYLETAESGQFKLEEAAGIFSRYLPYAIVFGVSAHWAKVFGDIRELAIEQGYGDIFESLLWFNVLGGDHLLFGGLSMLGDGGLVDLFDGGGLDALGGVADLGDLAGGLGDFAGSVGDFIGDIDFDF